jgi:hypothetical protein
MKAWQAATLVVVLLLGVVVVTRRKANVPKTTQSPQTSNNQYAAFAAFGAALGGKLFAPSAAATSAPNSPCYTCGVGTSDTRQQQDYALSHGVVEQQGNELVDLNTGNALVYGPERQ